MDVLDLATAHSDIIAAVDVQDRAAVERWVASRLTREAGVPTVYAAHLAAEFMPQWDDGADLAWIYDAAVATWELATMGIAPPSGPSS